MERSLRFGTYHVRSASFSAVPDARPQADVRHSASCERFAGRNVSVRLIRGDFSNNITDFPVEMQAGGKSRTVKTDDSGRAEFRNLPVGENLKFVAVRRR